MANDVLIFVWRQMQADERNARPVGVHSNANAAIRVSLLSNGALCNQNRAAYPRLVVLMKKCSGGDSHG